MKKIYKDSEVTTDALKGKTVAVIGYGSQGHAHARNLHESGLSVVVGLYEGKGLRNIRVISVGTQDGKTVKVELCGNFEGLFGGYLFRVGAPVCSEGLARLGR